MGLIHTISNVALRGTLFLFADYSVEGREHIPPAGPLLVVANHQSNIDPPLLGTTLGRGARFLAKEEIFRHATPPGRWFLRSYGAHPLRRGEVDVAAYRWAMKELERQRGTLVIFPEGTRNPGPMGRAAPGVAMLAARADLPVLPVAITGTERLGTWLRVFNPTGRLRVRIGEPFRLVMPGGSGRPGRDELEAVASEIMGRVARLLPEENRGAYARAAVAPFRYTESLGGDTVTDG